MKADVKGCLSELNAGVMEGAERVGGQKEAESSLEMAAE